MKWARQSRRKTLTIGMLCIPCEFSPALIHTMRFFDERESIRHFLTDKKQKRRADLATVGMRPQLQSLLGQ